MSKRRPYTNKGILDSEELKAKAEKVRLKYKLTPLQAETIRNTAYDLYNYLGDDLPGTKRSSRTKDWVISRDALIEIVLDASRLERALQGGYGMRTVFKDVRTLVNTVKTATYEELTDLIGPAFRYAEYEAGPGE